MLRSSRPKLDRVVWRDEVLPPTDDFNEAIDHSLPEATQPTFLCHPSKLIHPNSGGTYAEDEIGQVLIAEGRDLTLVGFELGAGARSRSGYCFVDSVAIDLHIGHYQPHCSQAPV